MSYCYRPQLPNLNVPVYVPRHSRPNHLKKVNEIFVDLSPLNRKEGMYVPSGETSEVISGVWLSAVIGGVKMGDMDFLGKDESRFAQSCVLRKIDPNSIYEVVQVLNSVAKQTNYKFALVKANKWDDVLLALMEGNPVMVGGTVYSSFYNAELTGIVPMPAPGEDLLGGQFFSLVSFNQEKDLALAYGNRGTSVGNNGRLQYRGSYLRNLGICRDFFVLETRISYAA